MLPPCSVHLRKADLPTSHSSHLKWLLSAQERWLCSEILQDPCHGKWAQRFYPQSHCFGHNPELSAVHKGLRYWRLTAKWRALLGGSALSLPARSNITASCDVTILLSSHVRRWHFLFEKLLTAQMSVAGRLARRDLEILTLILAVPHSAVNCFSAHQSSLHNETQRMTPSGHSPHFKSPPWCW